MMNVSVDLTDIIEVSIECNPDWSAFIPSMSSDRRTDEEPPDLGKMEISYARD
jgi:hypothetical protein